METKLNNIQLENIKQILTLRYSTNLENLSLPLQSNNIQNSIIETPEIFIEKSIREAISDQVKNKNEKIGISLSSGIDSTLNPSLITVSTNLLPGSEINGVPASETRARFKLFPK